MLWLAERTTLNRWATHAFWAMSLAAWVVGLAALRNRSLPPAVVFGAVRERLGAHAGERLKRGAQMLSGVEAAAFAAEPLPVKKVSPRELESRTGTGEVLD